MPGRERTHSSNQPIVLTACRRNCGAYTTRSKCVPSGTVTTYYPITPSSAALAGQGVSPLRSVTTYYHLLRHHLLLQHVKVCPLWRSVTTYYAIIYCASWYCRSSSDIHLSSRWVGGCYAIYVSWSVQ